MLTPHEIEARRPYLTYLSIGDGPLQPDAPHATVNTRRWFRRIDGVPVPTSARRRLHEQILGQWRAANRHVARERSAIVMAGPPGTGKLSIHEQLFRDRDQRRWRELDANVFKRCLLDAALADGTFEELVPPELRSAGGEEQVLSFRVVGVAPSRVDRLSVCGRRTRCRRRR
uniref:Uncharacterized protein n=1 Tax=Rhodococcus erythropolis TaxID=1833 RepID=Q6XMV4_RHOER|nr:hypothetical protein PBD2.192 [Rhodococcus erythropolis]